jgi:cytosine/adenosine deaminase-related metal-dependent hydrolase
MRLGAGAAPVTRYLDRGVPVGLGVDGSASNDSSNMLAEVRQALLLNRVNNGPGFTARQALEMATTGGAGILGRDDIGKLAPGHAADFIAIDLNRVEFAGSLHDPVAATVLCAPARVDHSWVGGRRLVEHGEVVGVDVPALIESHNRLAFDLGD